MLQLFDFADPNALTGKRDQTTVPAQSLFLMNSPMMIEFASDTSDRLLNDDTIDDVGRVDLLYQLALSRSPTSEDSDQPRRQAWISACQAVLASSEFRHIR
jgi:hypothetical protein